MKRLDYVILLILLSAIALMGYGEILLGTALFGCGGFLEWKSKSWKI